MNAPYDPMNFDEFFAPEYGGYTSMDMPGTGGGRGGPRGGRMGRGGPRGGRGGGMRYVLALICF